MATISLRLSDEDKILFENYAKFNNVSLSKMIKNAVIEKIEDEYDLKIAENSYEEYLKDGKKSYPIEDLWEELDL